MHANQRPQIYTFAKDKITEGEKEESTASNSEFNNHIKMDTF